MVLASPSHHRSYVNPGIRTISFEIAIHLVADSTLIPTGLPLRYHCKPNNALLVIPCFCTTTKKAVFPYTALSMSASLQTHSMLLISHTYTRYPQSYNTQMHAVYNKFKHRLFPDASPPRPLSNIWDLRPTNYLTTALSGTGMTPLIASQLSMHSSEIDAQVLRAQSAAAKGQKRAVKDDTRVSREEYLRSKKRNMLRKAGNG